MNSPSGALSGANIVVLGGGVAGLAAALELSRLGPDKLTVIEKDAAAPAEANADPRSEPLGAVSDETLKRLRELFGDAVVQRASTERVSVNGRLLSVPPTRMNLYTSFGGWDAVRLIFRWAMAGFRTPSPSSDAPNLERWLIGQAGEEMYRRHFRALAMKVWNIEPQRLSASAVRARAPEFTLANGAATEARYELTGGIEAMKARLIERLGGRAEILSGTAVEGFELDSPTRIQAVYARGAGGESQFDADIVVSTLPIEQLNSLLDLDEEEDPRPVNLRWRGVRTLFLTVDAAFPAGVDRVLLSDAGSRIHSAQSVPGGVAVDVICNEGDEVWRMRDEKLADVAMEELARGGVIRPGSRAANARSVFRKAVVPVYALGWEEPLRRAYVRLNAVENLFMIGRRALFIDGTAATGVAMARALGAFLVSGAAGKGEWNRAVRRFAPQALPAEAGHPHRRR